VSAISSRTDLNGQVVLITGALGGIGKESVKTFLREGARVVVTDYQGTETVAEDFPEKDILNVDCNIVDEEDVDKLVAKAVELFGRIDILVHCAGIYETTHEDELTLEAWKRMIDINLTGTFLITSKVFQVMKKQQYGKIINLASNAGQTGGELAGLHYAASKGGVIAYTKRLAKAGAKHNVYVNAIAPGPIESNMIKDANFDLEAFPLGRIGAPEDVAETAVFLSSQSSNFITGQIIGVNGGLVI
jgi:3-oxoacyl-[acyl-carrier protein] reductase